MDPGRPRRRLAEAVTTEGLLPMALVRVEELQVRLGIARREPRDLLPRAAHVLLAALLPAGPGIPACPGPRQAMELSIPADKSDNGALLQQWPKLQQNWSGSIRVTSR